MISGRVSSEHPYDMQGAKVPGSLAAMRATLRDTNTNSQCHVHNYSKADPLVNDYEDEKKYDTRFLSYHHPSSSPSRAYE